jgi:hypothetical protein
MGIEIIREPGREGICSVVGLGRRGAAIAREVVVLLRRLC